MTEKEIINEEDLVLENPSLNTEVEGDSELKTYLVNYVGEKTNPEDDNVTVKSIIDVMALEFPEFLMAVAEENWVRGYKQALDDVEEGEKMMKEDLLNNEKDSWIHKTQCKRKKEEL